MRHPLPVSRIALAAALWVTAAQTPVTAAPQPRENREMSTEIRIVEDFIAAFNAKDVDRIMAFFTADAVYHNMPTDPVEGVEAIRNVITSYVGAAAEVDWETLAIAQSGSTVLTERIDRFVFGDKPVALPVMGSFEIRDGKIAAWRDYFDQATWNRQMAP